MQIIARQAAQMRLGGLIKLLYDVEVMVYTKIIGVLQRVEPAGDFINGLEGIVDRQLGDNAFQLFGIAQGVIRTGRK
jgi:hypothetical protein